MNEQWKNHDADAHEAKAEAIANAEASLRGVHDAVDTLVARLIDNVLAALQRERELHEEKAKLGRVA